MKPPKKLGPLAKLQDDIRRTRFDGGPNFRGKITTVIRRFGKERPYALRIWVNGVGVSLRYSTLEDAMQAVIFFKEGTSEEP